MRKRYKLPIAKKGEYPHGNLIQVLDDISLDAIVANTMASLSGKGILADFDHYSELAPDIRKAMEKMGVQLPTNAGGWISNIYREGDTVWGDMVSTPDGEEAIESQTYCKTSPTFRLIDCQYLKDRGGKKLVRPLKVKSVALCNKPNMESLGTIMANRSTIENKEDDLQSVFLGSAMDILEKGKETMETEKEVIVNAEAVEAEPIKEEAGIDASAESTTAIDATKATVVETVVEAVATEAEAQGATPEIVDAVAQVAEEVATEAVDAVETAVEEAKAVEAPDAENAPNAEVEALKAKIKELEAIIEEAGKARQEAELQNRIAEELEKYPTLQNRGEASELLKKDWDLGTRFLSSLKFSVASKTIQNRVPAKSPEADLSAMTKHERLRFKMFGK